MNRMTREKKVQLLTLLFLKVSNQGVLTWGATENGYRWTCADHGTAQKLANALLELIDILKIDKASFPYRFQPEGGATVVFEPVDD